MVRLGKNSALPARGQYYRRRERATE